jgi:Flp pilus assembly protein TadG
MSGRGLQAARAERGSVLVSGLLLSLALLMLIGAAVDIGHAFIVRRELTSLADDAALAASQQLDPTAIHQGALSLDPARAQQTALATLSGDQLSSLQATATPAAVSVRIERRFPTVLLRLVGIGSLDVVASATAAPRAP